MLEGVLEGDGVLLGVPLGVGGMAAITRGDLISTPPFHKVRKYL